MSTSVSSRGSANVRASPWCCPYCRRPLAEEGELLACLGCSRSYALVDGIPDLRVDEPAWIDFADDLSRASRLLEETSPPDVAGAVRYVFEHRADWSGELIERRTRQVLASPERFEEELDSWLSPLTAGSQPVLDLGCGPGGLLAALARRNIQCIGIDVSMEWLVIAKRLAEQEGRRPLLACALAEALPLASGSVGAVAALDVIEHVGQPEKVVAEVARVARPGTSVMASTPNRFSLAAEPHVGLWGVGWLPRSVQARYVERRTHHDYRYVRLLALREIRRLFEQRAEFSVSVEAAQVPAQELERFPRRRALLAHAYNLLASTPLIAHAVRLVCPFFHVDAVKPVAGHPG